MRLKIILIVNCLLVSCCCLAQETKIISLSRDNNYQGYITQYDYSMERYDTLYKIQGRTEEFGEECAIDAFNGRYFFGANIQGYPDNTIFEFDINKISLKPLFAMITQNSNSKQGIEYDCFLNSLIYTDTHALMRYDLSSGKEQVICSIPSRENGLSAGFMRSYDFINQTYFLMCSLKQDSLTHWMSLDVLNAKLLDTCKISSTQSLHYLTFSDVKGSFYGRGRDGSLMRIDSSGRNYSKICNGPTLFNGNLNRQRAVFDSYDQFYIQPYWDSNSVNKITITELSSASHLRTSKYFEKANFQQLNSNKRPLIKQVKNYLIANYAEKYQWYRDGQLISGANSQQYYPSGNGNYFVLSSTLDGRLEVSNKIDVTSLSIEKNLASASKFICPNPLRGSATLRLDQPFEKATLQIVDISGKLIYRHIYFNNEAITIYSQDFSRGLYLIQLETDGQFQNSQKIYID